MSINSDFCGDNLLDLAKLEMGSGVYFLYCKNELVYIGKATNITRRIIEHLEDDSKVFDSVRYTKIPIDSMTSVETALIKSLKPKYNNTCKSDTSQYTSSVVKSRITITPVVLPHQLNKSGKYRVCIRVSYKRKSFYLKTNLIAFEEDVEKSRIINPKILKDAEKIIKPLYNAAKFIPYQMGFEYVKKKLTEAMFI